MGNRSARKEATRLERVASSMGTGPLKDHLQATVNSLGQATRLFEETGDPAALDVVLDNTSSIEVLARELRARGDRGTGYAPAPDAHLADLTDRFLRRRAAASAQEADEAPVPGPHRRPEYRATPRTYTRP